MDAPLVRLLLQEVKEVLDGQRGAIRRDAEDGLKEVIQELLKSSLREEIGGRGRGVSIRLPGPIWGS